MKCLITKYTVSIHSISPSSVLPILPKCGICYNWRTSIDSLLLKPTVYIRAQVFVLYILWVWITCTMTLTTKAVEYHRKQFSLPQKSLVPPIPSSLQTSGNHWSFYYPPFSFLHSHAVGIPYHIAFSDWLLLLHNIHLKSLSLFLAWYLISVYYWIVFHCL